MPDAGEAVWQSCTLLLNFDLFIQTGWISSAPVSPIKVRQSQGKLTGIRMEERRLSIVEFVMHLGINRDTIWQWIIRRINARRRGGYFHGNFSRTKWMDGSCENRK